MTHVLGGLYTNAVRRFRIMTEIDKIVCFFPYIYYLFKYWGGEGFILVFFQVGGELRIPGNTIIFVIPEELCYNIILLFMRVELNVLQFFQFICNGEIKK